MVANQASLTPLVSRLGEVSSTHRARVHTAPVRRVRSVQGRGRVLVPRAKAGGDPEDPNPGLGLKALWFASEQFGNLVGLSKTLQGGDTGESKAGKSDVAKLSRSEALALLKDDYDQNYFVSGQGKMAAYADDCIFADPFVSFTGTQRFVNNVSNLGGLMEDVKLKITGWEEGDDSLNTSWTFSCILDLPWKPKLAAGGGTTHLFDANTGLVTKHIEMWSVEPGKVAKSLLKPSAVYPTSKAEVIMMSVSEGDVQGIWFALSPYILKVSAPIVGISLLANSISGHGLLGDGVETTALAFAIVCGSTEVWKLLSRIF